MKLSSVPLNLWMGCIIFNIFCNSSFRKGSYSDHQQVFRPSQIIQWYGFYWKLALLFKDSVPSKVYELLKANSIKVDKIRRVCTPKSLALAENWLIVKKGFFFTNSYKPVESIFESTEPILQHTALKGTLVYTLQVPTEKEDTFI